MRSLPLPIDSLVRRLAQSGFEVWLIGSHANDSAHPGSDWDLLIFGNEDLIADLAEVEPVKGADVLVVFDGDRFRSPWDRTTAGVIKSGSLSGWKWSRLSPVEATYEGTKWPKDWGSLKRAERLEP